MTHLNDSASIARAYAGYSQRSQNIVDDLRTLARDAEEAAGLMNPGDGQRAALYEYADELWRLYEAAKHASKTARMGVISQFEVAS